MKKIYLEVKVVANNEVRNVAFAKGINRAINLGNVEKILAMMKVKGYRKAEMVHLPHWWQTGLFQVLCKLLPMSFR